MLRSWQLGLWGFGEAPGRGDVAHGGPVRPVGPGGGGAARAKQEGGKYKEFKTV